MTILGMLGMEMHEVYMIIGMALVTFGIRFVMFPVSGKYTFPSYFEKGLSYVPPAVLTAIIIPAVFIPSGNELNLRYDNPYLIGMLTACIVAGLFKNLLLTIIVSMGVFLLAQWSFAFV